LFKATAEDDNNMVGYQSVVGSQIYAMLCTRPDLGFAVSQISQFGATHEAVAKRVMHRFIVLQPPEWSSGRHNVVASQQPGPVEN
jgi:hypothetical protein